MLSLPERAGPRPKTRTGIPHAQIDQRPSPQVYAQLRDRFLAMAHTENGPSLISVPGARALFLRDGEGCNTRSGFLRGREFAHLHPPEDGSLHLVLAPEDAAHVLLQGWGELHPWASTGRILPTVTMVYAPRDVKEVDVVMEIARASLQNARIQSAAPQDTEREWASAST